MSLREHIEQEIQTRFYYIEYPNGTTEDFWKDGNGELVEIDDMGLDHLKACIRRIEKDMADFIRYWENFSNGPTVIKKLLPLAKSKLNELQNAFTRRTML